MHRNSLKNLLGIGLVGMAGAVQAEDFPRAGYEGAPNGLAAPFAGDWSLDRFTLRLTLGIPVSWEM